MYSVVLMMAMTSAPDMPAHHRGGGCCGCQGYGGGCFGGHRGGCGCFGRHNGGGCQGWGGGYGCHGWGNGCGCQGYSSGCGCMGYAANCGCVGGAGYPVGGMVAPPPGGAPGGAAPAPPPARMPEGGKKPGEARANQATIMVSLPADAKLYFDGMVTQSTSENRRFSTPQLTPGVDHNYTITAEITREGKTLTASQVVTVRAGEITSVNLVADQFGALVAAK